MADDNIIKNTFEYGNGLLLRCVYRSDRNFGIQIAIEQPDAAGGAVSSETEIFLGVSAAEKLARWLLGIRAMTG